MLTMRLSHSDGEDGSRATNIERKNQHEKEYRYVPSRSDLPITHLLPAVTLVFHDWYSMIGVRCTAFFPEK
ncbi:hypothetical protein [Microvirga massiliensis]|uniref:hypothetical protein n=1 Tax=Microvirga massiliensis TaxID=1033741 RepID=UPI000A61F44F|nr:hypothetical protein [Microvirga massiliensis]